jgi:hypothetical protein
MGLVFYSFTLYVAHDPEEKVSIPETNIICSSLDLLSELTEADLISFLNYLSRYPEFGSTYETGRAINEIIAQWDVKIGFEEDYYYLHDPFCVTSALYARNRAHNTRTMDVVRSAKTRGQRTFILPCRQNPPKSKKRLPCPIFDRFFSTRDTFLRQFDLTFLFHVL